jgi:hypothetical protein
LLGVQHAGRLIICGDDPEVIAVNWSCSSQGSTKLTVEVGTFGPDALPKVSLG